eukprot:345483-Chlamydomonas_euryale.AAC.6
MRGRRKACSREEAWDASQGKLGRQLPRQPRRCARGARCRVARRFGALRNLLACRSASSLRRRPRKPSSGRGAAQALFCRAHAAWPRQARRGSLSCCLQMSADTHRERTTLLAQPARLRVDGARCRRNQQRRPPRRRGMTGSALGFAFLTQKKRLLSDKLRRGGPHRTARPAGVGPLDAIPRTYARANAHTGQRTYEGTICTGAAVLGRPPTAAAARLATFSMVTLL